MAPLVVERIVAPAFVLMGLSHVVQPRLWVRFFEALQRSGQAAIVIPLYTLPVGLLIIGAHNVWIWAWPVVLTLIGWLMTAKCAVYLLVPGAAERMLESRLARSPLSYQVGGGLMAVYGAVLMWQAWFP